MQSGIRSATALLLVLASAGGFAAEPAGKLCKLEIAGTDAMQFDKKELKVAPDCGSVEVTLKHAGKLPAATMGHNWVLAKTADASALMNAGMAAGLASNYLPAGDKRVIASIKVVGGGQTASVTFPTSKLKKGEDYSFFCTSPGHGAIMKGKFIF